MSKTLSLVLCALFSVLFGGFAGQAVRAQSVTHSVVALDASGTPTVVGTITFSTTDPTSGQATVSGQINGEPISGRMYYGGYYEEWGYCWSLRLDGLPDLHICFVSIPGVGTFGTVTDTDGHPIGVYTIGP